MQIFSNWICWSQLFIWFVIVGFVVFFLQICGWKYLRSASRDGGSTQARLGATSGVIDTRFASANHPKCKKKGFVKKRKINADKLIKIPFYMSTILFVWKNDWKGKWGRTWRRGRGGRWGRSNYGKISPLLHKVGGIGIYIFTSIFESSPSQNPSSLAE